MAIWPWRTKPTVQPWGDNWKHGLISYVAADPLGNHQIAIPDNYFAHVTCLYITWNNAAGARPTQYLYAYHTRANVTIRSLYHHTNAVPGQLAITYDTIAHRDIPTGYPLKNVNPLSLNLHTLPGDIFRFEFTGLLGGDVLTAIHIHAKLWEVY